MSDVTEGDRRRAQGARTESAYISDIEHLKEQIRKRISKELDNGIAGFFSADDVPAVAAALDLGEIPLRKPHGVYFDIVARYSMTVKAYSKEDALEDAVNMIAIACAETSLPQDPRQFGHNARRAEIRIGTRVHLRVAEVGTVPAGQEVEAPAVSEELVQILTNMKAKESNADTVIF